MYQALRHNILVLVLDPEKSIKLLLIIFAYFFSLLPTITTTTQWRKAKQSTLRVPQGRERGRKQWKQFGWQCGCLSESRRTQLLTSSVGPPGGWAWWHLGKPHTQPFLHSLLYFLHFGEDNLLVILIFIGLMRKGTKALEAYLTNFWLSVFLVVVNIRVT